jgi:hypothetical protein
MIVVVMRDENNANISHIKTSLSDATGGTIAGVDNIKCAVDDKQI